MVLTKVVDIERFGAPAQVAFGAAARVARIPAVIPGSFLIRRMGWSGGIMLSGVTLDTSVVCGSVVPCMLDLREER